MHTRASTGPTRALLCGAGAGTHPTLGPMLEHAHVCEATEAFLVGELCRLVLSEIGIHSVRTEEAGIPSLTLKLLRSSKNID